MHQPGRPSSSTAQHVINMSGMDPGLGLMGQIGGGAPASISTTTGLTNASASSPASSSTTAAGAMAANAAMMAVNAPPGAYRASPSRQHAELHANQSPRPPGSLSPQRGGSSQGSTLPHSTSSAFTSPQRMPQYSAGLSPPSSAGTVPALNPTGQLGRSQSLGHAAYQQYQQHQQHLQQQQQQQQGNGSVTYQLPLSPSAADMYSQQRRDRSQQYSDSSIGNGSSTMAGASLLPTINTHIPSSSLSATSPYASPNVRQALPPLSPGAASPYGSSYVPTASSGSGRPTSMIDGAAYGNSAAGSSAYTGAQTLSPVAGSSKRASVAHMQGLDPKTTGSAGPSLLPMHHSSHMSNPYGDSSLPLYSSGAARSPSSPYMPVSPTMQSAKVGAPPRTSVGGSFSPATLNDHRMSVEVKNMAGAGMDPAHLWKERRGTLTNHDTVTNRLQLGEFDAWDRQQRAQRRRMDGFRRVRDLNDLKVNLEPAQQGKGRRADPLGGYVSPLKAMTAYLHHTYHLVNPAFFYELSFNPRRVLTKPSRPMYNDGHDNEDSDYILYVNDWLGSEESNRYLILDILGQGTFGQVVKCQNMKTREIVAVKVIKNKPAYFNQSMMEVTILEMLNGNWDPNDEHHILRLRDTFIHAKHLCLVFELLSSNLYELIKQNSFRGLSTSLVRVFTTQLLDALTVLHEARLIHCDLKPENILLKTLQTPSIKLVDFGSACHERQTVYTYIQSRFYRSPEVLLGLPYNASIDMWSLGCIAIELFLGLPLFPGTSEYNQICRIVEMLGLPPRWMLEQGKQTGEFFNAWNDEYGRRQYKLKGLDQYSREHNVQEQPSKRYFQATTLPDIVKTYPLSRKSGKPADVQKEMANRTSFIDFVSGLLSMDPNTRWTPEQAKLHPFITGEKFTQPFNPPLSPVTTIQRASIRPSGSGNSANSTSDKHPFGGLVTEGSNRSSGRTYQDAAAYNQHLAQQHAYNQAHQARQNQVNNNPYARDENPEKAAAAQANAAAAAQAQMAHAHAHAQAQAQAAQMHVAAMSPPYGQPNAEQQQHSGAGYTANRSRSNTLTRMDVIPPQLAKMGLDQPGHSMTPVLSREESLREWERQQQANAGISAGALAERQQRASGRSGAGESGKSRSDKENHHLDLLHQQAEQAHQQQAQWHQAAAASGNAAATYPGSAQVVTTGPAMSPSQLGAGASGSKSFSVMMDPQKQQQSIVGQAKGSPATAQMVAPPPPAMFANTGPRQSNNAAAGLTFDPYQSDIAQLMPALQPMQYHTIGHSAVGSPPGAAAHARVSGGSSSGIGISGSGGGNAMNRHSIAVTHMSSPHQYATGPSSGLPGSGSLANLQGLYASPTTSAADAGMHAASVQQPPPSAAASTTVNASGTRSDGFGGLSDLMFGGSGGGGASGARVMANPGLPPSSPLAAHRYSTTAAMMNGPMSPHHQQHGSGAGRAITPTRSPIDATSGLSGGGVYQSNVGGRRF